MTLLPTWGEKENFLQTGIGGEQVAAWSSHSQPPLGRLASTFLHPAHFAPLKASWISWLLADGFTLASQEDGALRTPQLCPLQSSCTFSRLLLQEGRCFLSTHHHSCLFRTAPLQSFPVSFPLFYLLLHFWIFPDRLPFRHNLSRPWGIGATDVAHSPSLLFLSPCPSWPKSLTGVGTVPHLWLSPRSTGGGLWGQLSPSVILV